MYPTNTKVVDTEENNSSNFVTPKFCPQCGNPVKKPNARFCTQCGRNFGAPGSDTTVASHTPPQQSRSQGSTISQPVQQDPTTPVQSNQEGFTGGTIPQSQLYGQRVKSSYQPRTGMFTENDVRPVQTEFFTKNEWKYIAIFSGMGYISHLMRFFIMFNSFPNLINFLVPIPLYFVCVTVIFAIQKYFLREKGIDVRIEANRFDFTLSLVFSSLFLTLLPPRMKMVKETTSVPETIYVAVKTPTGTLAYQEIPRAQYFGSKVRTRMHLMSNAVLLLFTFVLLMIYFNSGNSDFQTVMRLVSMYVGSFIFVELAPIYGRSNGLAGQYGRLRTLLVFIVGFLMFITPLLGEQFFVALQNLNS